MVTNGALTRYSIWIRHAILLSLLVSLYERSLYVAVDFCLGILALH